jgi:hypothetical protein
VREITRLAHPPFAAVGRPNLLPQLSNSSRLNVRALRIFADYPFRGNATSVVYLADRVSQCSNSYRSS